MEDAISRGPRGENEKFGDRILHYPRLNVPNQAFRNRGDLTFEPAGDAWGFNAVGVAHGMAVADLDGDGDLDVVVNNLNGAVSIYRNDSPAPRIAVRLQGQAPNTRGIGAKITLSGGPVAQSQEMICGGRYLSSDDSERVFAAWKATNRFTLTVAWRSGAVSTVSNVAANTLCEVAEADAVQRSKFKVQSSKLRPLFADVSSRLGHVHRDAPFDDFARQPLLSRRLSHGGPGVAWADIDGDGRDDLVIGSGRGGALGVFRNASAGRFERMELPPAASASRDDQTAIVAWREANDTTALLVGSANYEATSPNGTAVRINFTGDQLELPPPLSVQASSVGPLALADIDGDGDLDLFVGGQMNGGNYPQGATSRLFRNERGRFVLAADMIGLINGAVFTDLDGDGFPELVLASEWGPVQIFHNDHGKLSPWNPPVSGAALNPQLSTLNTLHGWWQGVTAGDFDGDGRMDIVASNWGRNSPYQSFMRDEIRIFHGDFSGAGPIDGVEAYVENGRVVPWRDLDTLARAMPWLRQKFPSNHAFANASMAEVLGERMAPAKELRVNWPDSTVFLNRGDHFEVRPLPIEAQFAPAFGVCVADFDGDGNEDIFLAQNFFETDGETSRYDAGRGLLLHGDGRGGFSPVLGQESGLLIYGDQRGAAAGDFDGDGRVDLVVGQNSAETKLFHNETAKPGLRVRLRGPGENLDGIGAVARRVNGTMKGAAHEIHAGSGHWSQDSATLVLTGSRNQIWVRWAGGKETLTRIPAGATSVVIDASGNVIQ